MSEETVKLSGETVMVACKLPNGLHMDLVVDGAKKRYTLKGNALPRGADVTDKEYARIVGGFAFTEVPKAFFDAWMRQYKDLEAVKNGLIFARSKMQDAEAIAREKAELKSGLEPIAQKDIPKDVQTMAAA